MNTEVDAQVWYEIATLITEFQRRLDHGERGNLGELFTPDALMNSPHGEIRGAEAIAALFATKPANAPAVSRHSWSNLRIQPLADGRMKATMLNTAWQGDDDLTLKTIAVSDITEIVARGDDGRWRFDERAFGRVFVQNF